MRTLARMKLMTSIDLKTFVLLLEAFIYLGWARFIICLPFTRVVDCLGIERHESPNAQLQDNKATVQKISYAIGIMSKHAFWDCRCLVKAIAGMKMLERRQIESTIYLGTAKDDTGKLIAHAWLRSGPYFVTGAEQMGKFTVVGKFARKVS